MGFGGPKIKTNSGLDEMVSKIINRDIRIGIESAMSFRSAETWLRP